MQKKKTLREEPTTNLSARNLSIGCFYFMTSHTFKFKCHRDIKYFDKIRKMSETIKYIYPEFLFYKFPEFWESIWNRGL